MDEAARILSEPDRKREYVIPGPQGYGKPGEKVVTSYVWGEITYPGRLRPYVVPQATLIPNEEGIARYIEIREPGDSVKLADVVASFGVPEYVLVRNVSPEEPWYQSVLAYPSRGMTFYSRTVPQSQLTHPTSRVRRSDFLLSRLYYEPTSAERDSDARRHDGREYGDVIAWNEIPD